MKRLLSPKVLIPVILSVAILAALLFFGDIKKVVGLMERFNRLYLVWFLALMVVYEGVRCAQWHFLLKSLHIHVPLRSQVFAFAAGEVTKSMPIGNYFQNYLLQQAAGTGFGFSSAATTFIILIEVFVSLVGVVIIGVGSWSSWLRPLIIVGVAVFVIVAWSAHLWHAHPRTPKWVREHKSLRRALDEFRQFRDGAADLFHPHIVVIAVALGAIYLIVGGAALYLVVRGLHIGNVSLWQALAVYYFSLAFSLIIPLPLDVGAIEVSGVGAFLAVGVPKEAAVSAMLVNRVLSLGSAMAIALIAMIVLRDEFRAALGERPHPPSQRSVASETADRA